MNESKPSLAELFRKFTQSDIDLILRPSGPNERSERVSELEAGPFGVIGKAADNHAIYATAGETIADLFLKHGDFESIELDLSVDPEYDDQGGTYRSYDVSVSVNLRDGFDEPEFDPEDRIRTELHDSCALYDLYGAFHASGPDSASEYFDTVPVRVKRADIQDLLEAEQFSAIEVYRRVAEKNGVAHNLAEDRKLIAETRQAITEVVTSKEAA